MLLTKLHIPPIGNSIIQRSELYEKLNQGLTRKLLLISAPAGFGKSTLLSDWIHHQKIPTAWFSLDKADNDPVEFLSYVIAGIQTICNDFGQSALSLLKSSNESSLESITGLLINDILKIEKDFFFVLDDFHVLSNNEIFKIVSLLLDRSPENIHVVISTRSDPSLPLARLRSKHQMVELRSTDLRFSTNDIFELFNKKLKCRLSLDDINSLEQKTEGWIAGLQLMALTLQNREDVSRFIQDLKGDNRYIMDYLMEEVLKLQSDDIRDFLLQTSVLEQMSGSLCNAVLSRTDSASMLEMLDKNNMFIVSLDNERQWYRYHHLFADLLKQRFLQHEPTFITAIHNKASDWFEQHDMIELAINHALESKHCEKATQLLGKIVGRLWENGQHAAILKYCEVLPETNILQNLELSFYYSWILITSGQNKKAEPFLTNAEVLSNALFSGNASTNDEIAYAKKMAGKIAVAYAYSLSHEQHSDRMFDYCKKAMEMLSDDDLFWYSWAWFSKGIAEYSNGDVLESCVSFNKAFDYSKRVGNIYLLSTIAIRMSENDQLLGNYTSAFNKCNEVLRLINEKGYLQITKTDWTFAALYLIIGSTYYIWAENERAYDYLKTAYELSKSGKDIFLKIYVLMVYSVALNEQGSDETNQKIAELEALIRNNTIPPFLYSYYIGWKLFFFIETNRFDDARIFITEQKIDLNEPITHANESAYSSVVRLLLEEGKLEEAETLLNDLYTFSHNGKRTERVIEILTSQAILETLKGNKPVAIRYLIEAMELASDENLVVNFVFSLRYIKDLLPEVYTKQATSKTKISKRFIENLQLVIEKKEKHQLPQNLVDLSSREIETLKLIAENLSNQEIADKLFISLNTVKTHLKNSYLKLEVDSRAKAVEKAKAIGLL